MLNTLQWPFRRGLIVYGFFLLSLLHAPAQRPHHLPVNYYSVKDGLSFRTVTSIVQDGQGFVWIGTQNGLNRFDGYEFLTFGDDPDQPFSIAEAAVQRLEYTPDGHLLIFYEDNLIFFERFDPVTFERERVNLLPQNGIKGIVRKIALGPDGRIFVVSLDKAGVNLFSYRGNDQFALLQRIEEERRELSAEIHLLPLADGAFFLYDKEQGLRRIDPENEPVKRYSLTTADFAALQYPAPAAFLHRDGRGRVWFALHRQPGVYRYDPSSDTFERSDAFPARLPTVQFFEDRRGNLLAIQSADRAFRPAAEAAFCLTVDDRTVDLTHLLEPGQRITTLHSRDLFQEIFIGLTSGFKTSRNHESSVQNYLSRALPPNRQGAVMSGIASDDQGYVYFACENENWRRLDTWTNRLDTLFLYDQFSGRPVEISCSTDLATDNNGHIWGFTCPGSGQGQLVQYDTDDCIARVFPYPYRFSAIAAARSGVIWLTTAGAQQLVAFDPQAQRFETFFDESGNNPLANHQANCIYEDRAGQLWIGARRGLLRIDPDDHSVRFYSARAAADAKPPVLPFKNIYVITENADGSLWLGGPRGLAQFDPESGLLRHYDQDDGLSSNIVCGLVHCNEENLWISTFNGLSYFDSAQEEFHNFFQFDGLSQDEFNRSAFHKKDGRLYFGGVNGVSAFYPEDLLVEKANPPIALSKIVRYNSWKDTIRTTYAGLAERSNLVLSPYDEYFEVHFMLPDFVLPQRNQFKFYLEGLDNQWTFLRNTPYIRFNGLPAGRYTLHVLAADPNGNWGEEALTLDLRVKQVFYKQLWFLLLLLLLFGTGVYFFSLVRLRQKLRVERLRTRLSSDLHDEVSGLLSSIAMQSDVLQMMTDDDRIKGKLGNIAEVSRKAMTKMSDVIWSIDSRKDRVEDLLQRMHEHADDVLLPLNIRYRIHVGAIDRQRRMPVDIRQELFFMFKEALNNIAKHSRASQVDVHFGNASHGFEMMIKDNGNGRTAPTNRSGQGLSNLRMRAQRIQADLKIDDRDGYTIRVRLGKFA